MPPTKIGLRGQTTKPNERESTMNFAKNMPLRRHTSTRLPHTSRNVSVKVAQSARRLQAMQEVNQRLALRSYFDGLKQEVYQPSDSDMYQGVTVTKASPMPKTDYTWVWLTLAAYAMCAICYILPLWVTGAL